MTAQDLNAQLANAQASTASGSDPVRPARPLTEALRAVRIEEAERTGVVVALREAAESRLAILRDRLGPAFAEVPKGIDLFDIGLTPGDTPRLWIDMIAFVEMGRDRRTYRFLQDTRNGRVVLAEAEDPARIADRITRYMARRLIERDRLLALPPMASELDAAPAQPAPAAAMPVMAAPAAIPLPEASSAQAFSAPAGAARLVAAGAAEAPIGPSTAATEAAQAESARTGGPSGPAPARSEGGRLGVVGGLALFLIGVAAGAGGLLALAQILSRY
ncbi:hypothetical protein [Phreatobacter sp.]|uniref:hypothetical protein n=1 Tax=Phreatobacter sp. TaxID=1966341 RepID=UPI003F730AFC